MPAGIVRNRYFKEDCMKKVFWFGISCLVFLTVLACTSVKVATVPLLYTNNENVEFEILGEVLYESADRPGYIGLLKAARDLYPECDYVIDIMAEQRTTTRTTVFLFWNSQTVDITWVMRGTAIKYKR